MKPTVRELFGYSKDTLRSRAESLTVRSNTDSFGSSIISAPQSSREGKACQRRATSGEPYLSLHGVQLAVEDTAGPGTCAKQMSLPVSQQSILRGNAINQPPYKIGLLERNETRAQKSRNHSSSEGGCQTFVGVHWHVASVVGVVMSRTLVFDNGAGGLKAGIAGQLRPSHIMPNCTGRVKGQSQVCVHS